jgi:hypothetical protein
LNATISLPSSRAAENIMATDNAVSALGKICEHQRDSIDGINVSSEVPFSIQIILCQQRSII